MSKAGIVRDAPNFAGKVNAVLQPSLKSLGFAKVRSKWIRRDRHLQFEVTLKFGSTLDRSYEWVDIWVEQLREVPPDWSDDQVVIAKNCASFGSGSGRYSDSHQADSDIRTLDSLKYWVSEKLESEVLNAQISKWWRDDDEIANLLATNVSLNFGSIGSVKGVDYRGELLCFDQFSCTEVSTPTLIAGGDIGVMSIAFDQFAVLRCRRYVAEALGQIRNIPGIQTVDVHSSFWSSVDRVYIQAQMKTLNQVVELSRETLIPDLEHQIRTDGEVRSLILPSEDARYWRQRFSPRRI